MTPASLLQIEKVFIRDPNDFKVKQYKNVESKGKYCCGDTFNQFGSCLFMFVKMCVLKVPLEYGIADVMIYLLAMVVSAIFLSYGGFSNCVKHRFENAPKSNVKVTLS